LELPRGVLDRAEELLDSETRQMGDLIREMEDQKALIDRQVAELSTKRTELDELETTVRKQREKLERTQVNARRDEARKFAQKLEEKERILEEVLQRLKSDPSKKLVAKSWNEIKYVKRDAFAEAENVPGGRKTTGRSYGPAGGDGGGVELVPLSEMLEFPVLAKGDRLVVCKKGPLLGEEATILTFNAKKISVSARGMAVAMKPNELALPTASMIRKKEERTVEDDNRNKMSNVAAKALSEEEYSDRPQAAGLGGGSTKTDSGDGAVMRMSANTVDVLGCNFEEARRLCEDKFSGVMMNKNAVVYILHGHGEKGVLKKEC